MASGLPWHGSLDGLVWFFPLRPRFYHFHGKLETSGNFTTGSVTIQNNYLLQSFTACACRKITRKALFISKTISKLLRDRKLALFEINNAFRGLLRQTH